MLRKRNANPWVGITVGGGTGDSIQLRSGLGETSQLTGTVSTHIHESTLSGHVEEKLCLQT